MKKFLLLTTILAASLGTAANARAESPALALGISGYMAGYGIYTNNDEPTGTEYRSFDFRKVTEVDLTGEVTLDNGVTAGAEIALLADRADGTSTIDRSMLYVSGKYGRVNFGEEDGAAALLQVTAPAADEEFDGAMPDLGTFATT